MTKLFIIGSGGHAHVLASTAHLLDYETAFIDERNEANFFANPPQGESWHLICGIGSVNAMSSRNAILKRYAVFASRFISLISPKALVDVTAKIAPGVFIGPGAIVINDAKISAHCIINTGAIIEHDVTIGENTHIATGARILGAVVLGANVHVGAGATILQGLSVGDGVVVGAAAFCNKDIPANSGIWFGIPARVREVRT